MSKEHTMIDQLNRETTNYIGSACRRSIMLQKLANRTSNPKIKAEALLKINHNIIDVNRMIPKVEAVEKYADSKNYLRCKPNYKFSHEYQQQFN